MVKLKMSMDENRKEGAYFRNIMEESVMVRLCSEKKKKSQTLCFADRGITFLDITAPRKTF